MNNNSWFKKENPFQTVIGYGGGATGFQYHSSAVSKPYMEDLFSTYLYDGSDSPQTITNGVNLAGGGLTILKARDFGRGFAWIDTVRGATKAIQTDGQSVEATENNSITSFNNNGFTVGGNDGTYSDAGYKYASYSFKKQEKFLDIVKFTLDSSSAATSTAIPHSLGVKPGMVVYKQLTGTGGNWFTWHRGLYADTAYYVALNQPTEQDINGAFFGTAHTSTTFCSTSSSSYDGEEFIAYVFAGNESTAAGAVSVDFDGNDWLSLASNADLCPGTSDFTFEAWIHPTAAWSTSSFQGIYVNYQSGVNGGLWIGNNPNSGGNFVVRGGGVTDYIQASYPPIGQWTHVAVTRSGSTLRLFYNGILEESVSNSIDFPTALTNIGSDGSGSNFTGKISNLRFVKGTALYTLESGFIPSTVPLTNITNTKLLCCQSSTTTTATVTPGTITANGDPTADTQGPFDDPDGFVFGENEDQNVIKCGKYVGSGTAGLEVYLGWEPQWVLIKRIDTSKNWYLWDSMRGIISHGDDLEFELNLSGVEASANKIELIPTGFKIRSTSSTINPDGGTFIYMAIRRPDGYVGKPASAATDVFTMAAGDDTVEPSFAANFAVDYAFSRKPVSSYGMVNINRLTGTKELFTYNNGVTAGSDADYASDYNDGYAKNRNSTYQAWMWKRSAGMDVLAIDITASEGQKTIRHNLNAIPEMIFMKSYTGTDDDWIVYNKYLNGGTNPNDYYVRLNENSEEASASGIFGTTTPTATSFSIQTNYRYTGSHVFQLFASANDADGNPISKVGSYVGDGTTNGSKVITLGFEPRFIMIKGVDNGIHNWDTFDSIRGFGAGVATNYLQLNNSNTQANAGTGLLEKSTTSFTVGCNGVSGWNSNGRRHIYYAHA